MGEKKVEKSKLRPWLDKAEEDAKFQKGIHGETSDRWTAIPKLEPCWKGVERIWRIEEGTSYQDQCWCPFWECFINPSGGDCVNCKKQLWPEVEFLVNHAFADIKNAKQIQELLMSLVIKKTITPEVAAETEHTLIGIKSNG